MQGQDPGDDAAEHVDIDVEEPAEEDPAVDMDPGAPEEFAWQVALQDHVEQMAAEEDRNNTCSK